MFKAAKTILNVGWMKIDYEAGDVIQSSNLVA